MALIVGVTACEQTIELWPEGNDAGTDAATVCRDEGAPCAVPSECCTGACVSLLCARTSCRAVGETCVSPAECCGGICAAGFCALQGGCVPNGESCTASAQCCSRACATDGTGRVVCQGLGGCRQAGELCTAGAECCSAECIVFDVAAGLGRCGETAGCAAAGEICRVAGDPLGARECCPGGPGATSLCRASGVEGLDRCVSERSRAACLGDGEVCAAPSDCCGLGCRVDASGALVCASSCAEPDAACTRDADCCTGTCTSAGRCAARASACRPLAATCVDDAACCSGVCGATGSCTSPLF